jgi:hypothetical protein
MKALKKTYLITLIIFLNLNSHDFVYVNKGVLHPQQINLASVFITNEINEKQVITYLETILSNTKSNRKSMIKFIDEYINKLNQKRKLRIKQKINNVYEVKIKKSEKSVYTQIIDLNKSESFLYPSSTKKNKSIKFNKERILLTQLGQKMKTLDALILTPENYQRLKKYYNFKVQTSKYDTWELPVLEASKFSKDDNCEESYIYETIFEVVEINNETKYIIVLKDENLFTSKRYITRAQILHAFINWIEDIYKERKRIGVFCNEELNELIRIGFIYKKMIDNNPQIKIDFDLIQDEGIKYYVMQYKKMRITLDKIKKFNEEHHYTSTVKFSKKKKKNALLVWKWSSIKKIPKELKKDRFIAGHKDFPNNKIVYIPHIEGREYMFVSDLHGNDNAKNSFTNVIKEFEKKKKEHKDVVLILLGDYCDRGKDVILDQMLDLYRKYTDDVIMLKGNHEQSYKASPSLGNVNFGITLLKDSNIERFYESLPLVCIIDDEKNNKAIICMHGGLPLKVRVNNCKGDKNFGLLNNIKKWLDGDERIFYKTIQRWGQIIEEDVFPFGTELIPNSVQLINNYCREYFSHYISQKKLQAICRKNTKIVNGHVHNNSVNGSFISVCSSGCRDASCPSYLRVVFNGEGDFIFEYKRIKEIEEKRVLNNGKKRKILIEKPMKPRSLGIREALNKINGNDDKKYLEELKEINTKEDFEMLNEKVESIMYKIETLKQNNRYIIPNWNFIDIIKEFPNVYRIYLEIIIRGYLKEDKIKLSMNQVRSDNEKNEYRIGYAESNKRLSQSDKINFRIVEIPKIDMLKVRIAIIIEKLFQKEFNLNLEMRVYNIAELMLKLFKLDVNLNKRKFKNNNSLEQELENRNYKKFLQAV